jgi:hypothetical protein
MRYHDCNDFSIPDVRGLNALYVVLKPGVIYEPGVGSFVIESDSLRAAARR